MNRDIPGDSFTLEDIIKEYGGGKKAGGLLGRLFR